MDENSLHFRRRLHSATGLSLNDTIDTELEQFPSCNFNMDLNGYSSVGTQTPTDDCSFVFPESFSPSLTASRTSLSSSIGTQTDVFRRVSYGSPNTSSSLEKARPKPKLFRRHSTGSDVYNFSASPTLTAFGRAPVSFGNRGYLTSRMMLEDAESSRHDVDDRAVFEDSQEDVESIGQQLRKIADDFQRVGSFRQRSMSQFIVNMRRRNASTSSSS